MTELEQVEKKIERTKVTLKNLLQKKDEILSHTKVQCGHCGSQHEIRDLEFIQTHYYVRPYSCSGGDYWNEDDEGISECLYCGGRMRFYNMPEIMKLRHLFAKRKDEHDERKQWHGFWKLPE